MEITKLEQLLAQRHGRKHAVLTSRGTVAIYAALKAMGFTDGSVVLPAVLCLSVANTIRYAGFNPIFCDVSLADYTIDPKSLAQIIERETNVRAVIAPHLYGHLADLKTLEQLTQSRNIVLIEDVAQGLGGQLAGAPLGSFGDFSILSFGHSKNIDAGGGGALLFDSDEIEDKIRKIIGTLPLKSSNHEELARQYSAAYYAILPLARAESRLSFLYSSFPELFKSLYLFRDLPDQEVMDKIKIGLDGLATEIKIRQEQARFYADRLNHPLIKHPTIHTGSSPWRYSFLLESRHLTEIADYFRRQGLDLSHWYLPLHRFFYSSAPSLPNAEHIGSYICNLWLGSQITVNDLKRNVEEFLMAVKMYEHE